MFVCNVRKDRTEFVEIVRMENKLFGDLALRERDALDIFELCPECYSALYDSEGIIDGYSAVFPMKATYASAFINGSLSEPEIRPGMLARPDTPEFSESHCYISSVVVSDRLGAITRSMLLTSLLSWRMSQMSRLSLRRIPIFMITASEQGDQMVGFSGAKMLRDGSTRRDGKAVFGRSKTPGFMARQ